MSYWIIIPLSFAYLLTGCKNDGMTSSPSPARTDSASVYQDMAYRAMFADSLVLAESYAYRSFMLSPDSTLERDALSLLCYIYYREGKKEELQMMMQTLSPDVYINVMDVQMQVEQQKADRRLQYYAGVIIILLLLSGGAALWYLHKIRCLRHLYQQRINRTRQLMEQEPISDNRLMTSQEIAETKLGFDVLCAIINGQNISQMGKREEQALLKTLPVVDASLCATLAKASSPLTPKETFFCLMEYYGKSDHQKALSFCCSDQAIRSTKSRLNKKLDIMSLT